MQLSEATEKVISKFVTNVQFRNSVLQTPTSKLAQESLLPKDYQVLLAQIKNSTQKSLDSFDIGSSESSDWLN